MADRNHQPLLSIIVPFYGVEHYIGDCLESLRQQTLTDFEVICVDDGCLDNSLEIVQRYVDADARFRVVRQENQGLGPARNTGVRHATGKYLTFVDSDDIIAPRAYSRLVGTLEMTGSSFAVGNAYRFARKGYVTQSWAHRNVCAKTRLKTHISKFPELANDRMVWNKVYRRSFWDAGGYEFPAIRYEDYPVTLRAHLEASSVDVLEDHVYFWRGRGSGESITQKAYHLGNLLDRFQSDWMVLDLLDEEGTEEVTKMVHQHFVDVDLMTFAEAYAEAEPEDRKKKLDMAVKLADRLPPVERPWNKATADFIHDALRDHDFKVVETLGRWRLDHKLSDLARGMVKAPSLHYPDLLFGLVKRKLGGRRGYLKRRLRVNATKITRSGDSLRFEFEPILRKELQQVATARIEVVGHRSHVELPIEVERTERGIRIVAVLRNELAEMLPQSDGLYRILVRLRAGVLRWVGQAFIDRANLPGAVRLDDQGWIQPVSVYVPRSYGDCLKLARLGDPLRIAEATLNGDEMTLRLSQALNGVLRIHRPSPTLDFTSPVTEGVAVFSMADFLSDELFDNPVTLTEDRAISVTTESGEMFDLVLACPEATLIHEGISCTVRSSRRGFACLRFEIPIDRSVDNVEEKILESL